MTNHETMPGLAPQPTRCGRVIRGLLAGPTLALLLAVLALAA